MMCSLKAPCHRSAIAGGFWEWQSASAVGNIEPEECSRLLPSEGVTVFTRNGESK